MTRRAGPTKARSATSLQPSPEMKRSHANAKLLATIDCMFVPRPGKSAGLRMSIWTGWKVRISRLFA
jgi:hypothetical protein